MIHRPIAEKVSLEEYQKGKPLPAEASLFPEPYEL
jgi:hypothetical protein